MYYLAVCNHVDEQGKRWGERIVKSYPHKEQCITWLMLKGYVYTDRYYFGCDERFRILEDL